MFMLQPQLTPMQPSVLPEIASKNLDPFLAINTMKNITHENYSSTGTLQLKTL